MEKFARLDAFLNARIDEIYPEPNDAIHDHVVPQMFERLCSNYGLSPGHRVLDVGCGQGYALEKFRGLGAEPVGLTFGEDYQVCRSKGFEVHEMDQSFLDFDSESFDLVWCRHCLEHSIFPYFTLSEFFRVLKPGAVLYVEVPAPDTISAHQSNPNHYSVLGKSMWRELLNRAGFEEGEDLDVNFQLVIGPDTYWSFFRTRPKN